MKPIMNLVLCAAIALTVNCFDCACVTAQRTVDKLGLDDPLVIALLQKDYSSAAQLLKRGYPIGGRASFNQAPAYWVIEEGDAEGLRLLIRFGLNVNFDWGKEGGNLLTNAVQFGHIEQVRVLVEAGASLVRDSRYGRSPLYAAVIYGHKDIEHYLRDRGAQFNEWDLDAFRVLGIKVQ
jgi:ankyrin repeat protein